MDKKETMQTVQTTLGNIFSKSHMKKAGVGLLICGILAGGGAWYHHQQKQTEHAQQLQARTTMIEAQAAQNNVALLDTENVRALSAQAIGIDETAITFQEISLLDNQQEEHKDKKEKKDHEDKKHSSENAAKKESHAQPASQDYEALAAAQTETPAPAFQPVYKVSCKANNVNYSLRIDAVTGNVLQSKIGKK